MDFTRLIQIDDLSDLSSYKDWQPLYMDDKTGRLIPNTKIQLKDKILLEINSLGCKGPNLEEKKPVIGVIGDSVTFGVSMDTVSWVDHINIPGYQTLNMGVEGYDMNKCVERFKEISEKVQLEALLVYVGWHNIVYGDTGPEYWEQILNQFAGEHALAFFTIGTPITADCVEKGLDQHLRSDQKREDYANYFEYNYSSLGKDYFNFWCNEEPTKENIKNVYDGVQAYNEWIQEYCSKRGYALFDFHSFIRPKSYEEVSKDFYDVGHLRPTAYEKVGKWAAGEVVTQLKLKPLKQNTNKSIFKRLLSKTEKKPAEDLRKNIYPLW